MSENVGYERAELTMNLRTCNGVLQQLWIITNWTADGHVKDQREEWRDVPQVDPAEGMVRNYLGFEEKPDSPTAHASKC